MTVGGNHGQRSSIIPTQFVNARIGAVQHSQTIGAGRHRQYKMPLTVDNHLIAQESHMAVAHRLRIHQLVVRVEAAVLQDDGLVVFPPWEVQGFLIRVADNNQASQPLVDLLSGLLVGMGVIHVGAGGIVHAELIDITAARRDIVHRVAVHVLRHMKPVPMDDVGFGQVVFEVKAHFLASLQKKHRAEVRTWQLGNRPIRAFQQFAFVFPDSGGLAR